MAGISLDDISIGSFRGRFDEMNRRRKAAGLEPVQDNPADLLDRASSYGLRFSNGSLGWGSNIWSRSKDQTSVVLSEDELKPEHRELMRSCLEIMHTKPVIKADANLGQPGSRAEMRCRLWCDPQFPDIAYRWQQLNFPGNPDAEPDAELFMVPHYLNNPPMPGGNGMLRVIRFPNHRYTIVTASSYQGEAKKGFLSHWIYHVFQKGGTGEHASLKEFTVRRVDDSLKKIVMGCWGLTGSGKSTHGLYVFTPEIARHYASRFGINPLDYVSGQALKNDDITGWFEDQVVSPESGAWTKTEGVGPSQAAIYRAANSPRAMHENTEYGPDGGVSFDGGLFTYRGRPNQNARSVLYLEDTGYFDGSVDSTEPPNMAVFITPAYLCDFAWVKIADPDFAAKVLADGRTINHPAQGEGDSAIGEEKNSARYCAPFTMGAGSAAHVNRFHEMLRKRQGTDGPMDVFLINTTGRVGAEYEWLDGQPKPMFVEQNGRKKVAGGTGPSIEETELFLLDAAMGAVEYEPHPIWGRKVLVPTRVPGIGAERLQQLNPFHYRGMDEMRRLLSHQLETSAAYLDRNCRGLRSEILCAMDF